MSLAEERQFRDDPALAIRAAAAVPRKYAESKNQRWFYKACFSNQDTRSHEVGVRRWNGTMSDDPTKSAADAAAQPRKVLTPAAQRALAEAEARRREAAEHAKAMPKELHGPKGPEPTRYGDWERKGITSDF
jgi:hypothetical protein